ncbi:MAG: hypothetical protein AB1540_03575 [Bdellovibrionota bacterium]
MRALALKAVPKAPKRDFDIDWVFERVAEAVSPYPQAALFELAREGYDTAFELLIACIESRTAGDMP